MSGTDLGYAAKRCRPRVCSACAGHLRYPLRACYAMSGTDLAYGATRAVLAVSHSAGSGPSPLLRDVRD
eukprot:737211-Rhodomonas_salina.1